MIYNYTKRKIIAKEYKVCKSFLSKLRGQMFRRKILPMLFVFDKEQRIELHSWFVKEPLDLIFINSSWEIVELMQEFMPRKCYKPREKAMYVLEMPVGTIAQHNIEIGDVIHIKR